mmetsp:Transcript_26459/g.66758  ORF Transcript_26459/g.66758 Transcript_26459/m.66758 type:complete len:225 (+) Transcript_26459:471-1145(+)
MNLILHRLFLFDITIYRRYLIRTKLTNIEILRAFAFAPRKAQEAPSNLRVSRLIFYRCCSMVVVSGFLYHFQMHCSQTSSISLAFPSGTGVVKVSVVNSSVSFSLPIHFESCVCTFSFGFVSTPFRILYGSSICPAQYRVPGVFPMTPSLVRSLMVSSLGPPSSTSCIAPIDPAPAAFKCFTMISCFAIAPPTHRASMHHAGRALCSSVVSSSALSCADRVALQ